MNFDEFHNHKWAKVLKHACDLWEDEYYQELYYGEDLPDGDYFPGLKVMTAYLVGMEGEMPLHVELLLKGAGHPEWKEEPEIVQQAEEYFQRFLDDKRMLIQREKILQIEQFDKMLERGLNLPDDWHESMQEWQQDSEEAIENDEFSQELLELWLEFCLRSVLNYNRHLIKSAVIASAIYHRLGADVLCSAVEATTEEFMWRSCWTIYNDAMPKAGLEELSDMLDLNNHGMMLDQWFDPPEETREGEVECRRNTIKNCQYYGVYRTVAEWNNHPPLSLGCAICHYCEAHGRATLQLTMPPTISLQYRRIQSWGLDGKPCIFELKTKPADDLERLEQALERVFGKQD